MNRDMKQLTIHLASIAPLAFYPEEQPRLPALELLLSRGRAQSFSSRGDCSIFEVIGMKNISYARQRLAGEEQQPQDVERGHWYCADPVHLRADRDQVILAHPEAIEIEAKEADALIAAFNQLFSNDGIQLWRATNPCHWYLHTEQPWQLSTAPLGAAENSSIRQLMPEGEDAQHWRKVLAEVEMLFFAHPVNQQRSDAGRPTISSLWLWGVQQEQRARGPQWDLLVGEHPLLKGAHRLQGIELLDGSSSFEQLLAHAGHGLVVVDGLLKEQRTGAHQQIQLLLQELEQRLFEPALSALRKGELHKLTIQPANGSIYRIKRRNLLRFWRRIKPVWSTLD